MNELCWPWDSRGGGPVVRARGQDLAGPRMGTEASLYWLLETVEGPKIIKVS